MGDLTTDQIRALRWISENGHTRSQWSEDWLTLELSGPTGSIRIPEGDVKALKDFVCPAQGRGRIFGLSPAGRLALSPTQKKEG